MIMGEFFKGWRIKIGVMTLVMACVFLGGWVRSRSTVDLMTLYYAKSNCIFVSGGERFLFVLGDKQVQSETNDRDEGVDYRIARWPDATKKLTTHWHSLNASTVKVYLSRINRDTIISSYMMVPYWSIIIPLTLMSAWLLLSKPRKLRQSTTVQPIPVDAT